MAFQISCGRVEKDVQSCGSTHRLAHWHCIALSPQSCSNMLLGGLFVLSDMTLTPWTMKHCLVLRGVALVSEVGVV